MDPEDQDHSPGVKFALSGYSTLKSEVESD